MARETTPKRALVKNAADPEQVKKAGKAERAKLERERNNRNVVRSTRPGRAFLWKLLGDCGLVEKSFSSDALWMAYREGRRSVATELLGEWDSEDPDSYLLAQKESIEDDQLLQAAASRPEENPTAEESDERND